MKNPFSLIKTVLWVLFIMFIYRHEILDFFITRNYSNAPFFIFFEIIFFIIFTYFFFKKKPISIMNLYIFLFITGFFFFILTLTLYCFC